MRHVVVVGHGRIGMPICDALVNNGASVSVLKLKPATIRRDRRLYPIVLNPIDIDWSTVDAVLMAFSPSNKNYYPNKYSVEKMFGWVKELDNDLPLLSVMAEYSIGQLKGLFGPRPTARFMCSTAVADHSSLRLIDGDGDKIAIDFLQACLPSTNCFYRTGKQFDFSTYGLVSAAMLCATVANIESIAKKKGIRLDREIVDQSFDEAKLMIRNYDFSPRKAFESALTPKGITEKLFANLFNENLQISPSLK